MARLGTAAGCWGSGSGGAGGGQVTHAAAVRGGLQGTRGAASGQDLPRAVQEPAAVDSTWIWQTLRLHSCAGKRWGSLVTGSWSQDLPVDTALPGEPGGGAPHQPPGTGSARDPRPGIPTAGVASPSARTPDKSVKEAHLSPRLSPLCKMWDPQSLPRRRGACEGPSKGLDRRGCGARTVPGTRLRVGWHSD